MEKETTIDHCRHQMKVAMTKTPDVKRAQGQKMLHQLFLAVYHHHRILRSWAVILQYP
jgi:hypothetical protein